MYPKGYIVIDNNVTYMEKEDELDKEVKVSPQGEMRTQSACLALLH